jgi:signal transduction histidine kinase
MYRVVQEALANVVRHSGAATARVALRRVDDSVVTTVSDDGRGFTAGAASTTIGGGLGILGMQERAAVVGGRVMIESDQGKGTRVTVVLPIAPAGADDAGEV